jgi:hypothetical protein
VTFTATVAPVPGSGTLTGSVQFKADGVNLGGRLARGRQRPAQHHELSVGSHVITAEYSPVEISPAARGRSPDQQVAQADCHGHHR